MTEKNCIYYVDGLKSSDLSQFEFIQSPVSLSYSADYIQLQLQSQCLPFYGMYQQHYVQVVLWALVWGHSIWLYQISLSILSHHDLEKVTYAKVTYYSFLDLGLPHKWCRIQAKDYSLVLENRSTSLVSWLLCTQLNILNILLIVFKALNRQVLIYTTNPICLHSASSLSAPLGKLHAPRSRIKSKVPSMFPQCCLHLCF